MFGQLSSLVLDAVELEEFFLLHFYFWTVVVMCNRGNRLLFLQLGEAN